MLSGHSDVVLFASFFNACVANSVERLCAAEGVCSFKLRLGDSPRLMRLPVVHVYLKQLNHGDRGGEGSFHLLRVRGSIVWSCYFSPGDLS